MAAGNTSFPTTLSTREILRRACTLIFCYYVLHVSFQWEIMIGSMGTGYFILRTASYIIGTEGFTFFYFLRWIFCFKMEARHIREGCHLWMFKFNSEMFIQGQYFHADGCAFDPSNSMYCTGKKKFHPSFIILTFPVWFVRLQMQITDSGARCSILSNSEVL